MPTPRDVLALIERIRCISCEDERHALIKTLSAVERPTILSFLNAHGVNLCAGSSAAWSAFRASDVLLRDGVALETALPWLDQPVGLNMNGTDFIPLLLRHLSPRRVAVYGTAAPWLDEGIERLKERTPHDYVDAQHGFHSVEHYIARAREIEPDVIILAMGMPRQEEVAAQLKRALDHKVLIINGGAIIDFLAGRFTRAPAAVQRIGLEWAFRLVQEPRRLFRRYCVGAFGFAHTVMLMRRAAMRSSSAPAPAPMHKEL
ncbi:exopolysaccharide biosynthesis WecB/TagA/CpsF family protein [Azospirillum brasilense]|uniref:Exopolysaccharide biosynthesis WecB/TagA/CpsF family protein n=1 Tax=Azospirillum brasilense TaxID=192 RepID=A0A560ANS8_AZOBR|nr:exopolysaccharide biosynthesis WecB/TagA/CpsF family protein [Azospirillum brasilense]